jgi:hypothetical protein
MNSKLRRRRQAPVTFTNWQQTCCLDQFMNLVIINKKITINSLNTALFLKKHSVLFTAWKFAVDFLLKY